MAKVATDLVTRFVFSGSLAPLKEFNQGLSGAVKGIGFMAGALAGAAGGLAAWVTSISAANDAVGQLARTTGVSVEAIGELSYVASQNGSSALAMQSSLSALNKTVGQAAQGMGRGREVFDKLGISLRDASGQVKTADQVFMEFSKRAREMNLSGAEIQGFAERLGIDRTLIQTLQLSGEGMDELRKKAIALGRTTTEQSDQMLAYNDAVGTLGMAFDGLKVKLATAMIPQLTVLADTLTNKIAGAADTVAKVVGVLSDVFSALIESVIRMAPVLMVGAGAFLALKVAVLGVAGVLGILKAALPIAIFIALYAIIDDVMTAFEGGESIIAGLYETLTGGRSMVDDLSAAFGVFVDVIKTAWGWLGKLWDIMKMVIGGIGSVIGGIARIGSAVFGGGADPVPNMPATAQMIPPVTAGGSQSSSVNQDVRINVTSTNPELAAIETQRALQRSLQDGYNQAGAVAR